MGFINSSGGTASTTQSVLEQAPHFALRAFRGLSSSTRPGFPAAGIAACGSTFAGSWARASSGWAAFDGTSAPAQCVHSVHHTSYLTLQMK
jgi:hypothetical protein